MKLARQNDILFILISSFILTVVWIGFSLYHAHVTSTITDTQNVSVIPISPNFDTAVIDKLKTRTAVDPSLDAVIVASSSPTSSISATPTPALEEDEEEPTSSDSADTQ